MVNRVHILNILMVIALLLTIGQSTSLLAVDEEYFIPYTDNYGYEYDPQTGTYIKKDPPQSAPQQMANATVNAGNTINTSNQADRTEPIASSNVSNEESNSSIQLPLLIASLLGVLVISMVLVKTLRKGSQ